MATTKFTDNSLKVFYKNLFSHYNECVNRIPRMTPDQIYNELFIATQYLVEYPGDGMNNCGQLYHLEPGEKIKVYQAFNAIFYALPVYRNLNPVAKINFNPIRPTFIVTNHHYYSSYSRHHSHYDSFFMDWFIINSLMNSRSYARYSNNGGSVFNSGSVHSHPSQSGKNNEDANKALLALMVLALLAIAATLALVSLFYMLYDLSDSFERAWYNEGWMKAALSLSLSLAVGSITAGLMVGFAVEPLFLLAIASGFNPAFLIVFAVVSVSMLGAGLGCLATSLLYDYCTPSNPDAIDHNDAQRFGLTAEEEVDLIHQGVDPMKVKCAIVALRASIAQVAVGDGVPSFFSRHFGEGKAVQPLLQQVRQLRKGELQQVAVGELFFDCTIPKVLPPNTPYPGEAEPQPPHYDFDHYLQEKVLPEGYIVTPTAPPAEENNTSFAV